MSDSEDEILDVVAEGDGNMATKYDMDKLKSLRDSARFIRNVEKTYKQHMEHEKWKKLNMLAKILESKLTPTQFFAQFPVNKIRKIEAVIGKLKAKFPTLWDPTDVIVINDGEPSGSTAKTKASPNASNMTNAVNGTAKKALGSADAKNISSPKTVPAGKQPGLVRKSNPGAAPKPTAAGAAVTANQMVQKSNQKTTNTTPKATTPKAAVSVNSSPSSTTKAATIINIATKNSTKVVIETPKADFERRAKPTTLSLALTSSPLSLGFERRDAASSLSSTSPSTSIGSRRQDYVRVPSNSKSPVRTTQSPVGVVFTRRSRFTPLQPTPPPPPPTVQRAPSVPVPETSPIQTVSVDFERRCNPSPTPNVSVDFERRCNPSPPAAMTTDCLPNEVRLKSPSFQEARKKLAALSGTTNDSKVTAPFHTPPLASNCNDPRGRNSSYLSSTLSPPGQKLLAGLQPQPQAQTPPSPVPPPPKINGCGNGNNSPWSPNNSIPVKEFRRSQSIPARSSHNNNNHNHNLNLSKSRNHDLISGSPNREMPPFERGCFPNVNGKEPPRRFNNMPSGPELRDPRCGGGRGNNNNWGNNNGPGSQQQQQQAATYSGQGRGRCGPPYNNNNGYNDDWQTPNNNFSYNNKNCSNNNNNQMNWNANNNNHFNKNVNVNKSNANFGFRPAYNRERGPVGNAAATSNNINCNLHASGKNNNSIHSPVTNEPRTYREYLLAKEKRQKEAAEKQRKLDEAEKQRKLEAAEKPSQLDIEAATATNEVVASIEKVQTDSVQLDTSYRNLQLPGNNKKIDFKIPKKASLEKPKAAGETVTITTAKEKSDKTNESDDVVETWDSEQSSGNNNNKETGELNRDANKLSHKSGGKVIKSSKVHKSDKVDKAEKVSRSDKADIDKVSKSDKAAKVDGSVDKVKHSDKRDDSPKPKNKSEKTPDKGKMSETDKDQDKDRRASKQKDKSIADKPKEIECTDNMENEPPTLVDNTANTSKADDIRLSEVETEDSEQSAPRRSRSSSKAKLKEKPMEKEKTVEKEKAKKKEEAEEMKEEQKTEQKQEDEKDEQMENFEQNVNFDAKNLLNDKPKEEKLPKLPKLKVVLGPNAHAMVVIPSDAVSSKEDDDGKEPESVVETPPRPPTELRRIMQRRKSMMPVSSRPLVDKHELFDGTSLDYEDLVEHKREQEKNDKQQASATEAETMQEKRLNKNLAVMFEKTNDNCSISTHNILAGKRRSRLNGLTLNETELYKKVFQLPAKKTTTTTAAATSTKSNATTAGKRKRGRPVANKVADAASLEKQPPAKRQRVESESDNSVNIEDVAHPTTTVLPPPPSTDEPSTSTPDAGSTTTAPLAPPPPKRKAKRNELDKLNDDIAQMYYANDVMRATGRRTCTTAQQHSLAEHDSSRSSSLSRGNRSRSSSFGNVSNQNNAEWAPYIRNVARRGHPFALGSGLNRASHKAARQQKPTMQTKRCRVRVARSAALQRLLSVELETDSETIVDGSSVSLVKNINPEWHSMSSALTNCVICAASIKNPFTHYIQQHGEHYGARLPTGALQDLRAGINNRPIYRTEMSAYNFKCPFCQKQLELKNSSWVEHFARHTGEFNMQCSVCKIPRYRVIEGNKHAANCGPGGKLLITETYDRKMPVCIHVCHLCDFIQISRLNLERHMMLHHGLQKQSLTNLGQELLLYRIDGVPLVRSKTAANKLLRRHKAMERKADKNKESTKKTITKLQIKLTKGKNLTKMEPLERPDSADKPEQTTEANEVEMERDVDVEMEQVEILSVGGSIGMPPTLPEEEQLLVINECKFELPDEEEQQAQQQETVPQTVVELQLESEPESETESMPKLEVLMPVEEPEQANLSLSLTENATQNLLHSLTEQEKEKETETEKEMEMEVLEETEQELEIESETESISETRPKKSKSIFRNFQKFCNKLKSVSTTATSSSASNGSSKGTGKLSNKSPAPSVSDSDANDLDSLHDVPMSTLPQPASDSAKSTTSMMLMISVQNVAYRLRSTTALKPAYYCRYPGCLFLFSNELEGLENHFKSDHPLARWNGSCIECKLCSKEIPDELSIKEELRHMVETHMDKSLAPTLPASALTTAEPELPKLRVRRFTGDRLAVESETLQPETVQPEVPQTAEAQLVTETQLPPLLGDINENTMLKDLLATGPCPPSQQQLDLNAAGVGEFLCAKTAPASASVNVPEAAPSSGVINQTSELGLAINQVFSLADGSIPSRITPVTETVTLPAVRNDDFVLTQSVTQNVDGQTPAEIIISIEPHPDSPAPVAPSISVRLDQRTHLIADRFRCMASNCNYCAHTVMCIREHMKFHSFGFGSKDYLRCAYCSHVGKDINDYVRHGVIDHGLANRIELEEPRNASSELRERIRDVLNQRTSSSAANSTPTVPPVSHPTAGSEKDSTLTSQSDEDEPISQVITEILKHTGFDDNKLYACPIKGCSGCLSEENFGNHVLFHMSSTGCQLSCKYCRQTFDRPAMLKSHMQQMHGRHRYFCSICLETTVNPRLMLQHMHIRHKDEFQRMNFQQQFVELTAYHRMSSLAPKCWVSAMEQPFGQKKMEEFLGRLIDEQRQRRNGTKNTFRTSELRLLSRMTVLPKSLQCAECPFKTQDTKALQQHLMTHKLELVRLAYPAEDHTADAPYQQQLAAQELVSFMEGDDIVISTQLVSSNELIDPKCEQDFVPGKQLVIAPKVGYVPKESRFVCGVNNCEEHLDTEQALRQHVSTKHMYSDFYRCVHCQYRENLTTVEKVLEHLSHHKRHVYQCGACPTILPKRYNIDRHIYEKHSPQDVDIIIHRRSDQIIHSKNTEARWFKSVGPVRTMGDEWFCNLCLLVLKTETLMTMHMEVAHKRNYQYGCPYCPNGAKDPITIFHHIRRQHPGKRIQPMQCYLRIKSKNRQSLGFYCNSCNEASNSYQKISKHCQFNHHNRYQFKCCHCDFGHAAERTVIGHMLSDHAGLPGLAFQQFDRLHNEFLDNDFWNLAKPFNTIQLQKPITLSSTSVTTNNNNNNASKQPRVFEPIDLVSSSDEELDVEDDVVSGVDYSKKLYEFACSHCTEISNDIEELKSNHWSHKHPEQPFYFCVQPQMCCPQCHAVKGNAKSLLENHLPNVHGITNLVACDIRHLRECAFCEYKYQNSVDLANHMVTEAHLANDLKQLTDEELNGLLQLGNKKTKNEYYQCELCRVIMPTQKAIGQHGAVEHCNAPERFCFRLVQDEVIYHCSFCMYASTTEMETLRHMLDHYKKFCQCHSCNATLSDGFEEYIQHCYTHHREDVKRFQIVHPYRDLKKFLMQVLYQFQNGLIISKSSLRNTRFNYERLMIQLHTELMRKSQQPPIPRLLISQLMNRNPVPTPTAQRPAVRITSRRKTLNPNDLQALEAPTKVRNSLPPNVNWHTSFTGRAAAPVVVPAVSTPAAVTPVAPATSLQQLPILQRIQKRRSTYVEPGTLTSTSASTFAHNGSQLNAKRQRQQ